MVPSISPLVNQRAGFESLFCNAFTQERRNQYAPHTSIHRWTELEESIYSALIKLGTKILKENLETEKKLSKFDDAVQKHALSICIDAGWIKRSTGRSYSSLMGHSIVVGALSRLVIAIHSMSKSCNKCKLDKAHDKTICPKNYAGTSGGMEPHGAIEMQTGSGRMDVSYYYVSVAWMTP
jgi:hypothetical protein